MDIQITQMKNRILCLLFLSLSGIVFSACTMQQPIEGEQISVTNTVTKKESLPTLTTTQVPEFPTQDATPEPTQTEVSPALANTPTATPLVQPMVEVNIKYVNQVDELPALSGKLAISTRGLSSLAYLVDLSTDEQITLGDPNWGFSLINTISPDHEKIILEDDKYQNYLVDNNGNLLQQINRVSPTSGIYGWLDNERLILFDDWDEASYNSPRITKLMNIYSDEIITLEPVYPDLGAVEFDWGISGLTVYHSQIPLVVYPAIKNTQTSIVFFDMEKQQVLAEFPAIIGDTHLPQWSPDGKYLLLAGNLGERKQGKDQEIYLVDKSGTIISTTLFANHGPREEFDSFAWSPDSQKIAFWINVFNSNVAHLAVFDLSSGFVTQYNISSKRGGSGLPIWSPDSQFIAVGQTIEVDDHKITLIHLDSGLAYVYLQTDEDVLLEGWVK